MPHNEVFLMLNWGTAKELNHLNTVLNSKDKNKTSFVSVK